ncbi:uncharacterized protein LOC121252346 [Juglans microcarpa x Juglans regia]|uniref:uncharacterized protein LOC121252346 n=1 Tax=Juglans microcarpa x Juglans regia TaxID=2249226 RepID=UPI001B7EED5E|nr:uncharacterized protein LOC121252346 [Juglans microcarpa x Juglans regia]
MVGETAKKLDHFLLVTVLLLMLFSPHTTRWGAIASSIQLDNGTRAAFDYQGRMEEPELLFDSEISRMLVDYQTVTGALNPLLSLQFPTVTDLQGTQAHVFPVKSLVSQKKSVVIKPTNAAVANDIGKNVLYLYS